MIRQQTTFMRLFPIAICILCFTGCGGNKDASNETLDPSLSSLGTTAIQLNWYPESEHGGVYQAVADGIFEENNLSVEIRPGGRATPVGPELELGRCQFAFANADDVIVFRESGIDVVAIMAAMQNHPRCILARKDSGVKSFKDLAGKTLQRQAGRAYVEFMRARGILEGVKEVPYHGSIASLVGDPNIVIQGYSCAEPLLAEQQGVPVTTLMVSELGFNPYSSVIITTGKLIREDPELVQRFVSSVRQGWRNYLTDASAGNELILAANEQGMTAEALLFGAKTMRDLAMPDDAAIETVGTMSADRWETLFDQLTELKLVDPSKVNASECYTLQFLSE